MFYFIFYIRWLKSRKSISLSRIKISTISSVLPVLMMVLPVWVEALPVEYVPQKMVVNLVKGLEKSIFQQTDDGPWFTDDDIISFQSGKL